MRAGGRVVAVLLAALLPACGEAEPGVQIGAEARPAPRVVVQDRYVVRQSGLGFEDTLSALYEALDRRDLTVFAVIDHAAAAAAEGLELPPTTVVVFGDPALVTPLMAEVGVLGAELPLRALVYERRGEVFLATTGMANLARTYPLSNQTQRIEAAQRALSEIADEVTGR